MAQAEMVGYASVPRSLSDTASKINFLDPSKSFTSSGTLTEWNLYAENLGDVSLRVWRPVTGGYELIGKNDYSISTLGAQSLSVGSGSEISVQANDIIGFHYAGTDSFPGIIPFDFVSVPGYVYELGWPTPDTNVGGVLGNVGTAGQEFRQYSLSATTTPVPEPVSILALGTGVLALLRRRRV